MDGEIARAPDCRECRCAIRKNPEFGAVAKGFLAGGIPLFEENGKATGERRALVRGAFKINASRDLIL